MIPLKEWTNGTPENNYQDGTQLDAADFESWNKELLAVLTAAAIAPDAAAFDQLLKAIKSLSWGNLNRRVASQVEAEAGLDDTYQMTSLKVAQAIAKRSGMPAGIPLDWPGITPPSWAVVRDGSALNRASYASLFAARCPTRSGTLTNGQTTVTGLSTTLDMWVGEPVECAGLPAGATVASITGLTSITVSVNATVSVIQTLTLFPFGYGSGGGATTFGVPDDRGLHIRAYDSGRGYEQSTLTANTTNASNVLSGISSTRGLFVGMPVAGTGIPTNSTITEIPSSTTVKISANSTATATARALTVTGRQVGAEGDDEIKSHTHTRYRSGSASTNDNSMASGSTQDAAVGGITATGGPENNVKRRIYLPIITIGA
ncbi:hypothetical protein [Pseudogulbenkiania ferrooxidans]|uniref:Tail fiber protein n=1 Tax=Pseudogulbenkiania ferrooxidans 2002 TaxID=279714 RepID=B9Z2Z1_9NEIS|nr:hypothetical protein [Pseudogulbenkiania ferrooxidans]EEG08944.1 hypothetical protein FuraDRAFT_1704 [Pseudogulbenkiania ferrooxidans 2002]